MEQRIFDSVSEAEKFRLQKIQEGYRTSITVAPNYVSVKFAKKVKKPLDNAN